jgi:AcrR family transcriptional regulator
MSTDEPTAEATKPQQARSRATQERLLDATVACLVELGYARTTTPEICRRAGVSQGALFKRFPSKQALLAATVAHLFASLVRRFGEAMREIEAEEDRLGAAIERLWAVFQSPALEAVFDLFTAGRTEPELAAALRPVVAAHRASYVAMARHLFPEAAENPELEAVVHTVMMALQGASMMKHVGPDDEAARRELRFIERIARQELARTTADRGDAPCT